MPNVNDPTRLRYELSRRRFLQAAAAGAASVTPAARSLLGAEASATPARPNVVLIVSDDQGWTDFGFMGHKVIQTPHLDKLAAAGALFPQAYVAAPLCRPSLASILTGLHPHRHGICCNDPPAGMNAKPADNYQLMKDLPTIPRLLKERGYRSLQTGKFWEYHFSNGGFTEGMTTQGRHGGPGLVIGRETMEPIHKFIDDCRGEPFFLWYAPMLPHQPHNPPKRLLDKYAAKGLGDAAAKYYAMCEWFDETCGALLDYLDKKSLRDNTLVAFVVDNGWTEGYLAEQTGKARGKRTPYDGGVRTPVILHWPGHTKPARHDDLVSSIDLAPTILSACGAKPTADMHGLSLLDVAAGKAALARKAVFGEAFIHTAKDLASPAANLLCRWVREGDWKLIAPAEAGQAAELFDLTADPFEKKDQAATEAERVQHLAGVLDAWWKGR